MKPFIRPRKKAAIRFKRPNQVAARFGRADSQATYATMQWMRTLSRRSIAIALLLLVSGLGVNCFAEENELAVDPTQQLEELQKARAAALQVINEADPMSEDFELAQPEQAVQQLSPEIQKLLNEPVVQRMIALAGNPTAQQSMVSVAKHPNRAKLLYSEIAFVIAMMILRAVRSSRAKTVGARLWVGFSQPILFVAGSSLAIPYFWIGEPYFQVLKILKEVVLG